MSFWKRRTEPETKFAYIHEAIEAGDLSAVDRFLKYGVNVHELDGRGAPPLQIAAARGHLEIAKLLVKKGADVNFLIEEGGTPLMGAAACLKPKLIAFLLSKGAQPNKKGADGRFPLICPFQPAVAAVDQQLECIKLLVGAGASINERSDSGQTPLLSAAWFGNAQAVDLLLELGADPTVSNNRGNTAAMLAFERHHDTLAALLKQAANRHSSY